VLPSGSLNHAERPMPGEVMTWSIVLNAPMSYSSNSIPSFDTFRDVLVDVGRPEAHLCVLPPFDGNAAKRGERNRGSLLDLGQRCEIDNGVDLRGLFSNPSHFEKVAELLGSGR
jgi:hypothetical protein